MIEHILSCSYGKDSLACIGACMELGWPIDRIVHAEVWATDTIPADLPPMVEFKKKADEIILKRYGIKVEHLCATNKWGGYRTYENTFYREVTTERARARAREHNPTLTCHNNGKSVIYGFPLVMGAWCNSRLKVSVLTAIKEGNISRFILPDIQEGQESGGVQGFPISINRGQYCQQLKQILNFQKTTEMRWCSI